MRYGVLVTLFALVFTGLYAQTGQLSGRVIDAKTHEPLPFTNVYVNKTTIGTTTNNSGEFVLQGVPLGNVEIVISFIGYTPHQLKVMVTAAGNTPLAIELSPDTQQLSEVEVKASRDKTWEKHLKKFEKVFLGMTSNCTILNPWIIEFTSENKEMKATASLPIEIENRILGYKLYFQLKSFSYSETAYSIVGNVRFAEMTTANGKEALNWMKNRDHTYRGSVRHLMKSMIDQRINQEGFVLYKDKVKGRPRSRNFSYELDHNLAPVDTASIIAPVEETNEFRIHIKDKVEVHYNYEFSLVRFYVDINYPVSWLEVRGEYILVNKEGNILNPSDVAISGEMAGARVSSMLPLDYKPGTLIAIQRPKNISAKRHQEKVYVHTDKPYYYPGDKIWFSAYMNYRVPGMADTLSNVLYVDLINSDRVTVQNRILQIDDGQSAGSFSLPESLSPGHYVLRAYTQWMRNYGINQFYYQPIPVLSNQDGVDEIPRKPVDDPLVKIIFDQPAYQKRSKVKMSLRLDTTGMDPVHGTFSVAVVDEKLAVPLKEINSINKDFEIPEPSKEMLTEFSHAVERGITIDGICKDKKGRGKKAKLTILPEKLQSIYVVTTTDNGGFSLKGLAFYDSAKFAIQPPEEKVILKNKDVPDLPENLPQRVVKVAPLNAPYVSFSGDTLKATMLREVNVTEKRTRQYENAYAQPDFYIKSESIETYQNVAAAIAARIPDFKLILYEAHWYLIWRRGEFTRANGAPAEPVVYVDQALVVGETAGDRLVLLNPATIDHIEVNGMIGSNLGANGANGLINVFTKRASDAPFKGLPIIKARGFDRAISFQGPNYDSLHTNADKIDTRSTLYWNPRVSVTSTHMAELSFFTSDRTGNYRVIIEGVTKDGETIHSEAILEVKEE